MLTRPSLRAPMGRYLEICLIYDSCLRGEYINCILSGSGGVFYQSFSLLPSISNLSVNWNPPINLPEGNASPLFFYLIIDSLLQQELFIFWRQRLWVPGGGCHEAQAAQHPSGGLWNRDQAVNAAIATCLTWALVYARDTKKYTDGSN